MKFGIEKGAKLIKKGGKIQITKEVELPNQERIRTLGKKGKLQVLEYIGIGYHQTVMKEYHRRTRKLPETKIDGRNLIKGINTWEVSECCKLVQKGYMTRHGNKWYMHNPESILDNETHKILGILINKRIP